METIQEQGIGKVIYPSSPIYAFNRNVIRIENCEADEYTFSIGQYPNDVRVPNANNVLEFDISRYLQMMFSRDDIASANTIKELSIDIKTEGDNHSTLNLDDLQIIWGGISAGFTLKDMEEEVDLDNNTDLTILALGGYDMFVRGNKTRFTKIQTTESTGYYTIDVSEHLGNGEDSIIIKQVKTNSATFDSKFDYTFIYKVLDEHTYTINVAQCPTEGIFVKWIDNLGIEHCRHFLNGGSTISAKEYGEELEGNRMTDKSFGYYGVKYQQGYTATEEVKIVVPNASTAESNVLKTLLTSPFVQYQANDGKWYDVRVKATSISRSQLYEDFVATIQLPDLTTQTF